jgi:hypothetical protein
VHRASFTPGNPTGTPTAKDLALKGWSVETRQSPWLGAQIDLNSAATKSTRSSSTSTIRLPTMAQASRVLCGVLVMTAAQSAPAKPQRIPQMFRFRSVKRLARNVAVGGRVHFRVEIAQPHVNPERRPTAAERAVAATPIERVPRQIEP